MYQVGGQIEPLTAETFGKIRKLIYEQSNIYMREGKQILVSNRLRKRVLALNLGGYEEYYRYLTEDSDGPAELQHFVDALSTNETYFYRETNHLTVMQQVILPRLFARKRRVVVWSAGCSSGEEPYTLQIIYEEGRGERWNGDLQIVATDVNSEVVARAREGRYGNRSTRFVPASVLTKYFESDGTGNHRVVEQLRSAVDFRVHNLLKDTPPIRKADVIFCRNVMIYFDKETQHRLTDHYFAFVLDRAGYLCIGHAESLSGTSECFRLLRGLKAPVYQLIDGGQRP